MIKVGGEPLVEFSFSSRLSDDLSREAVLRLVRQAWSENRRRDVTGLLSLDGMTLEQSIEGRSATILALAARILTDPRHCRIVVRSFEPIAARRFVGWTVEGLEPAVPQGPVAPPYGGLRLLACAGAPPPVSAPAQQRGVARKWGARPAP